MHRIAIEKRRKPLLLSLYQTPPRHFDVRMQGHAPQAWELRTTVHYSESTVVTHGIHATNLTIKLCQAQGKKGCFLRPSCSRWPNPGRVCHTVDNHDRH